MCVPASINVLDAIPCNVYCKYRDKTMCYLYVVYYCVIIRTFFVIFLSPVSFSYASLATGNVAPISLCVIVYKHIKTVFNLCLFTQ